MSITSALEVRNEYSADKDKTDLTPEKLKFYFFLKYNFPMEFDEEFMKLSREAKEYYYARPQRPISRTYYERDLLRGLLPDVGLKWYPELGSNQ